MASTTTLIHSPVDDIDQIASDNLHDLARHYWQHRRRSKLPLVLLLVEPASSLRELEYNKALTPLFFETLRQMTAEGASQLILSQTIPDQGIEYYELHPYLENMFSDWLEHDEAALISIKDNHTQITKISIPCYPLHLKSVPLRKQIIESSRQKSIGGKLCRSLCTTARGFFSAKPPRWLERMTTRQFLRVSVGVMAFAIFVAIALLAVDWNHLVVD